MEPRDFETIELEIKDALIRKDHTALKSLRAELKAFPEDLINQMPEVVYARYLRWLRKLSE